MIEAINECLTGGVEGIIALGVAVFASLGLIWEIRKIVKMLIRS